MAGRSARRAFARGAARAETTRRLAAGGPAGSRNCRAGAARYKPPESIMPPARLCGRPEDEA